jgi:hypothetical protein
VPRKAANMRARPEYTNSSVAAIRRFIFRVGSKPPKALAADGVNEVRLYYLSPIGDGLHMFAYIGILCLELLKFSRNTTNCTKAKHSKGCDAKLPV